VTRIPDSGILKLRAALEAPDLEGSRYRWIGPLGQGGMGAVILAEDTLLGREVALKVLHVEDVTGDGIQRMEREARTLARLEHPGIVPVHDLGQLPDGRVFYVMKRVRGERLDHHVTAGTPLAERLRLFLKLCEAVAFAHAAGVIHRDLKPENVMVGEYGEVLVLDWGVAKWTAGGSIEPAGVGPAAPAGPRSEEFDTRAGAVIGTPAFMPPEQALGGVADRRSDVFGLGATLWFLLTGRPPGPGGPRPRPAALASICERALASDPGARYASAEELGKDVERFLDGARVLAHREGPLERLMRFLRRHRVAVGLVLAYLVVRWILSLWIQR
jgi:serine/threonine protein kinase